MLPTHSICVTEMDGNTRSFEFSFTDFLLKCALHIDGNLEIQDQDQDLKNLIGKSLLSSVIGFLEKDKAFEFFKCNISML